ncbi:MAG TPA: 23S ribosomal RNA methyltransferase Erm [Jiangellaceae bacterium]|uniref:23S ribosomal RNA methyltransferase Erm n=1 Tax=Mycolicibacillus parakoreensis TaxID=1069221 RepID=A0ABY3U124_9MYCO|nr:23S ribosomal RNA methyltransferase Erm [Mycolicibacillus parakoreensis]MCV7317132.1 23S ribosomal RNA methyltransferase Erm [Mycolicibacillus parakoreensis]ULN51451.1 23S ribosomal RNA methyltransferase Erm [Mycolicibacillus parakoreensis]HLR93916.1 23S ribosomal RNA methyltransferase Erm [Jiangellaceae bacterium]
MPAYGFGRHEFGQNFLTDPATVDTIVALVSRTAGSILEIGPGDGALTLPLQRLGRPITAVEIDGARTRSLRDRCEPTTQIVHGDFLRYRLPSKPHVIVGNLPFDQTTAMLRHILHAPWWTEAILMTQWEVARRRAAVGGATMMTAQWWPWFEFTLAGRVPSAAFTPRPGVDAGLLVTRRRGRSLVARTQRKPYASFVHAVFTSKGRGLQEILPRVLGPGHRDELRRWLARQRFRGTALPRDLSATQWVELFAITTGAHTRMGPPRR